MKTFKDNAGRIWSIAINIDTVKRVKSLLGVDLMEAAGGKLIHELSEDPIKLVDVIFICIKPEADAKNITDADFGQAMGGDALDVVTAAFLDELIDFFPSRRRSLLRAATNKINSMNEKITRQTIEKIQGPELDQMLEKELGKLSGAAPESPA